jgi:hypothetical protein
MIHIIFWFILMALIKRDIEASLVASRKMSVEVLRKLSVMVMPIEQQAGQNHNIPGLSPPLQNCRKSRLPLW